MHKKFRYTVSFMVPGQGFRQVAVDASCREAAVEVVNMHYPQAVAVEIDRVAARLASR